MEDDEPEEQGENDLFRIWTTLKEWHRTLLRLAAVQADWKRGDVRVLKCRLCPGADFRDWEGFDTVIRRRRTPRPSALAVAISLRAAMPSGGTATTHPARAST